MIVVRIFTFHPLCLIFMESYGFIPWKYVNSLNYIALVVGFDLRLLICIVCQV